LSVLYSQDLGEQSIVKSLISDHEQGLLQQTPYILMHKS